MAACGDNKEFVFKDAGIDADDPIFEDAAIDAPPDALTCGANQTICNDTCVNTNTDNANCGACGTTCATGETCETGQCCASNEDNCGGTCIDVLADVNNCGACGMQCGTGQTCQNGTCCGNGTTVCGNQCFDLQTDEMHCGDCTTMCGSGEECVTGQCCPTGQIYCGGACVDPNSDEANCGGCSPGNGGSGDVCDTGTGETCSGGLCCPSGQIKCGNACVDPNSDEANCGACSQANGGNGDVCTGTETCDSGVCCAAGTINCNGVCIDPLDSETNCGGCAVGGSGEVCDPGETCSPNAGNTDATCCGPGEINCNGVCVDPVSDNANCGGCAGVDGVACTGGTPLCSGGQCATTCGPGETACNGTDCVDLDSDHNNCGACGTECAADQVCNNGTCSTMCAAGEVVCDGQCVNTVNDPNHCGNCDTICGPTQECVNNVCQLDCPPGETLCNGVCRNFLTDPDACGGCNTGTSDCGTGTCQGGICCAAGLTRCGNQCVDLSSNDGFCGSCTTACGGTEDCTNGICCAADENNCGGACSDPMTDINNCGGCGVQCTGGATCSSGLCCPAGQQNVGGICCNVGNINCNGVCKNPNSDILNCGDCGIACSNGQVCSGGSCTAACNRPNDIEGVNTCGVCTDLDTDPDFCGTGCVDCPTGAACVDSQPGVEGGVGAACAACPTGPAAGCGGVCTNTDTDTANCGGCAGQGGSVCQVGEVCTDGLCCDQGEINCNGQCVDPNSDEANCGGCSAGGGGGDVCGTGEVCTNGSCSCGFGQISCGGNCVTPAVDPNNCGACGNQCGTGLNAGKPYCASNGCVADCPDPLANCLTGGVGGLPVCANLLSDNRNCGACNNICAGNQSCVAGVCRTNSLLPLGNAPAKCVGGGPPISVPTDGGQGGSTCTGNLGATSFTFGLCSRTQIDIPAQIFTDAFNSNNGPYRPVINNSACTQNSDCGPGGICRGAGTALDPRVCIGGGIGVNGTVGPIAKTQQTVHVGGDFWAFGEIGLDFAKTTVVKQRVFNEGPFAYAGGGHKVYGNAFIDGPWSTTGGQANMVIDGALTTSVACTRPPLPTVDRLSFGSCSTATWDQNLLAPCGEDSDLTRPGGWDIPVRAIVEHFRNPANNDNQAIGLRYDALAAPSSPVRLELPCGYYYLNSLGGNQPITLVVKGRTALFIGGAADINVDMVFDVEPTASIDIFIGGVVNIAHPITLGSPAYPRLTRMYIGSSSVAGGGGSCTSVSQCGSGLCTACGTVSSTFTGFQACSSTPGTCVGGSNLDPAIDMSQGGNFSGLLWAGYGGVSTSNALEMYGSIFANRMGASGDVKIHYDNGAADSTEECPPPTSTSCESCRDCGNQPCVNNQCQATCTSDSQCCPPLRCDNGVGGTNRCVL